MTTTHAHDNGTLLPTFLGVNIPDVVLGRSLLDNSLVKRRSTSLSTRVGSQGAARCDSSTGLVDKSILVESSN
jgi:hypothetical protein